MADNNPHGKPVSINDDMPSSLVSTAQDTYDYTGTGLMQQTQHSNVYPASTTQTIYSELSEDILNDYLNSIGMSPTSHEYEITLDIRTAEIESGGDFVFIVDGKKRTNYSKTLKFKADKHMTRAELVAYMDGTQGIADLKGYKEGKANSKEAILDEIQAQVESLL